MSQKSIKRLLSSTEIDDILSHIKPNKRLPTDSALQICNKNKDDIRNQLINFINSQF